MAESESVEDPPEALQLPDEEPPRAPVPCLMLGGKLRTWAIKRVQKECLFFFGCFSCQPILSISKKGVANFERFTLIQDLAVVCENDGMVTTNCAQYLASVASNLSARVPSVGVLDMPRQSFEESDHRAAEQVDQGWYVTVKGWQVTSSNCVWWLNIVNIWKPPFVSDSDFDVVMFWQGFLHVSPLLGLQRSETLTPGLPVAFVQGLFLFFLNFSSFRLNHCVCFLSCGDSWKSRPLFFRPNVVPRSCFFERCRIILPQQYHHAVLASQSWLSYHVEAKTRSYTWHQSVWSGWKQIPWNTLSLPRRRHLSGFLQVFEEMKVLMLRLLDAHEVEMKHLLCFSQVGPASRVDKLLDAQNQPGNSL